jgi:hypothetical protein
VHKGQIWQISSFRNVLLSNLSSPFSTFDFIDPFLDFNIQFAKPNLKPKNLEKLQEKKWELNCVF